MILLLMILFDSISDFTVGLVNIQKNMSTGITTMMLYKYQPPSDVGLVDSPCSSMHSTKRMKRLFVTGKASGSKIYRPRVYASVKVQTGSLV